MIFHPYRHKEFGNEELELDSMESVDLSKGWYYSPHFHIIGFGWLEPWQTASGWIVKNIGVRGNTPKDHRIFELARYQLSHCGVNSAFNSYTWIGALSVNSYKAPKMPLADVVKCEECGSFFYPVACDYPYHFDKEGIYSVDPPGWHRIRGELRHEF